MTQVKAALLHRHAPFAKHDGVKPRIFGVTDDMWDVAKSASEKFGTKKTGLPKTVELYRYVTNPARKFQVLTTDMEDVLGKLKPRLQ